MRKKKSKFYSVCDIDCHGCGDALSCCMAVLCHI